MAIHDLSEAREFPFTRSSVYHVFMRCNIVCHVRQPRESVRIAVFGTWYVVELSTAEGNR